MRTLAGSIRDDCAVKICVVWRKYIIRAVFVLEIVFNLKKNALCEVCAGKGCFRHREFRLKIKFEKGVKGAYVFRFFTMRSAAT